MQRCKHIIALCSAVIVATVLLISCAADKFDDDFHVDKKQEIVDETLYRVYFNIRSVSNYAGTRSKSGDFVDGSDDNLPPDDDQTEGDLIAEDEHAIGEEHNYAIFFDEEGNLFGVAPLILPTHSDWPKPNIEAEYGASFYTTEGQLPSSVLLILNGGERLYDRLIQNMEANRDQNTLDQVLKKVWKESDENLSLIGRDKARHFTMTNSIYVDDSGKLQTAVPIDEKMVHKDGDIIKDDEILTIYVERMLAKFTFDVADNAVNLKSSSANHYTFEPEMNNETAIRLFDDYDADGILKYKPINWRVTLTGWNMNALEAETYLYKKIDANVNYFNGWQDAVNYRTYWAEDPNYGETAYPCQYRPAFDSNSYVYYAGLAQNGNNPLVNYSFVQLNDNKFGKLVYVPENTYNRKSIDNLPASRADLLAGSHLIVCANLETDIDGTGFKVQPHLYRDRLGIWYTEEKECVKAMVRAFHNELVSQSDMIFPYYNWETLQNTDNGEKRMVETIGTYKIYYDNDELTDEKIDEIYASGDSLLMTANIKDGDGKRCLWNDKLTISKDGTKATQLPVIIGREEKPDKDKPWIIVEVINKLRDTPADANEIRSLLLEWVGAVDHFNNGRMYYYAPVTNPPFTMGQGQDAVYGTVRNAWYQYTLTEVSGLGTPVDNPGEPIVPNRTGTYDQIKFKVDLIEWHTVTIDVPI